VKTANKGAKSRQSVDQVSELTTNRLSVYLRCLNALDASGVRTISSQALAEQFKLNAARSARTWRTSASSASAASATTCAI
jgi:hypothetical protein